MAAARIRFVAHQEIGQTFTVPYDETLPGLLTREALRTERDRMYLAGRRLVFTNGAFDLLHVGHVRYLAHARSLGDALAVGLNSDASVRRYKGEKRPIVPERERAEMLLALRWVDFVVIFDEDEPRDLIAAVLPHVLVKGADWAHYVSGREVVEAAGGRVVLAEFVQGRSTTNVINKILEAYGPQPSSPPPPAPFPPPLLPSRAGDDAPPGGESVPPGRKT